MNVLYEDNHCVAVVKPHGVPTQSDQSGDPSLLEQVGEFLSARDKKPGKAFVGLIHRLDRPVGGIVLFAKTSKGASRLSEQFRSHEIKKTYLALVEGVPSKQEGEVHQWLRKDRVKNISYAYPKEKPGTKEARLTFKVRKSSNGFSLIEIHPETGRSHQIRIAMKTLGTPIVGDTKYGSSRSLSGAIALCASGLSFKQPVTGERIEIVSLPDPGVFQGISL